jgi:adenylate cyclase
MAEAGEQAQEVGGVAVAGRAHFLSELGRRRVFRVLVGYGLVTFAVLQVVEPIMHALHLPDWVLTAAVVALGLGFPVAVVLAWAFDITPGGIERTPPAGAGAGLAGSRLALLLVGLGLLGSAPGLAWYFVWRHGSQEARLGVSLAGGAALLGLAAFVWRTRRAPAAEAGAPAAQAPAAAAPSIGVLPFADLSATQDQGYFCDGIADELLNALCCVAGLRVAARSSSFQFKGRSVDTREVARTLGVSTLLEGGVRKAGNRVRVSARLVSGEGYQLWSETFDRSLEDIFAIQEEIAQSVVQALRPRLGGQAEGRLTRAGTSNPQAYEMYLRGRQFLMSSTENGYRFARQMFKGTIELDPGYAPAHAGLADIGYFMLAWHLDDASAERIRAESLAASAEALRLDPKLPEAHVARANLLSALKQGEEAEQNFQRALALNPALPAAHYFHARHLFAAGRLDEAAREFEETARLDPDDYSSLALLVTVQKGRGDRPGAATAAARVCQVVRRRLQLAPDDVRAMYLGGGSEIQFGDRARGLELLARALELQPDDFATAYNVACGRASAGDVEGALDALERAVGTGRGSRSWIEHDTDLDPLRAHPRFQAMLGRLKG